MPAPAIKQQTPPARPKRFSLVSRPNPSRRGEVETAFLLKNPANAAHLSKSIAQYHAGRIEHHALTDD